MLSVEAKLITVFEIIQMHISRGSCSQVKAQNETCEDAAMD